MDDIINMICDEESVKLARKKTLMFLSLASVINVENYEALMAATSVLNTIAISARRLGDFNMIDDEALNEICDAVKLCVKGHEEECKNSLKKIKEKLKEEVVEILSGCREEDEEWLEIVEDYVNVLEEEATTGSLLTILNNVLNNVALMTGKGGLDTKELVKEIRKMNVSEDVKRNIIQMANKLEELKKKAKEIRRRKEEIKRRARSLLSL